MDACKKFAGYIDIYTQQGKEKREVCMWYIHIYGERPANCSSCLQERWGSVCGNEGPSVFFWLREESQEGLISS